MDSKLFQTTLNLVEHHYHSVYDQVFAQNSTQVDLFEFVKPQIKQVFGNQD